MLPPVVNPKRRVATWNGWQFYKVLVKGGRSKDILNTCKKHRLLTPCDHTSCECPAAARSVLVLTKRRSDYDGNCVVVHHRNGRHMSHNSHHRFPRNVIDRTIWYAGVAHHGWALMNWRNTHR